MTMAENGTGDGTDPTDESAPPVAQFVTLVRRHVAGLMLELRTETSRPVFEIYSGTVIAMGEVAFFLTAGHVVQLVNKACDAFPDYKVCICAGFGSQHEPSQLSVDLGSQFQVCKRRNDIPKDGIDVGLVRIPHSLSELRGHGIEPWANSAYLVEEDLTFDCYVISGFPEEQAVPDTCIDVTGRTCLGSAGIQCVYGQESEQREYRYDGQRYPWLVLDVPEHAGFVDNIGVPKSIKGMSGGPIFGFRRNCPDEYWFAGIQSWWDKERRTAYGCRIRTCGQHIILALIEMEDAKDQFERNENGIFVPKRA